METTPPQPNPAPTQLDLLASAAALPASVAPLAAENGAAPSAQREAFLRERLLAKARMSQAQALGHQVIAANDGLWQNVADGVRAKLLRSSTAERSLLVHMESGSSFTGPGDEAELECLVLQGEVHLGPSHLRAGDYLGVHSGGTAQVWVSPTGAQIFLRSQVSV